jgi:hypothetical protein
LIISNKTEIVQLKYLLRKCVKIEIDNDTYLSYCVYNEENMINILLKKFLFVLNHFKFEIKFKKLKCVLTRKNEPFFCPFSIRFFSQEGKF